MVHTIQLLRAVFCLVLQKFDSQKITSQKSTKDRKIPQRQPPTNRAEIMTK